MTVLPYIFVLLGAILWGTTGTAQTFLPDNAHPFIISAGRSATGGLFLLIIMILLKKIKFRSWPWKQTLYAAICISLFQLLFFSSVRLTGVAIASVVAIGSAPVFSGLIEWIFLKMRPTKVWGISTGLAIIGCMFLFITKGEVSINPIGVLYSLVAGLIFALYTMNSKSLLQKEDAISVVAMTFSLSALLLTPFYFILDVSWLRDAGNVGIIFYLGIATTSIAYVLYGWGLRKIPASSALTLSLAEPTTAALLGVVVVGEVLSTTSWVGIGLLLGSIVILTLGSKSI
ncbi:DMT family transporter [Psychrobacillus psychrodurans]|uniref:DMT family transporter n=1 Tax=Psychrobacillus psychrodurans TaxID=126157 RepID=UPI0008ED92F8|nr:EamA family transporter [Psychrobacillus psychrodurans]MCZ8540774.1 DMT family transporter [Psychrobacillus psychrodurans]SFM75190.1 drug/metabolite transporter, DME family [Psychrobacillus psychrodurans]